jgi:hypothetical protein
MQTKEEEEAAIKASREKERLAAGGVAAGDVEAGKVGPEEGVVGAEEEKKIEDDVEGRRMAGEVQGLGGVQAEPGVLAGEGEKGVDTRV